MIKTIVSRFRPWEKIDADDRWLALETAAEIIFSDKSPWSGMALAGSRIIGG